MKMVGEAALQLHIGDCDGWVAVNKCSGAKVFRTHRHSGSPNVSPAGYSGGCDLCVPGGAVALET